MFFSLFGNTKRISDIKQASKLDAAANAAAAITVSAVVDARHVLSKVYWSYSAGPTGGKLTITGGPNNFEVDITTGGPGAFTFSPYICSVNTALVATITAGGAGITGKLNIEYTTEAFR